MHLCWRSPHIVGLRRRAISKIAAIFLITLSVMPFSAPFKTIDLANSHDDASPGSLPKDKIDGDDVSLSPLDDLLIPPQLRIVVVAAFTCDSQLEAPPVSSTVLRL